MAQALVLRVLGLAHRWAAAQAKGGVPRCVTSWTNGTDVPDAGEDRCRPLCLHQRRGRTYPDTSPPSPTAKPRARPRAVSCAPPHSTPSTRVHLRNAIERAAPAKQTTRVSRDPQRGTRSSPAGFSDTCPCHVHRRWPAAQAARGLLAAWRTRLTELHAAGGWGQWQPGPWAPRRGEPTEQEALGRQLRGEAQV